MQYMELIPKEMQPVAGTDGAYYRRRQLMRQLPLYDHDPSQCRGLAEGELKLMEDFVKKYKAEALGVGEVALPGQGGGGKEEGKPQDKSIAGGKPPESTNGALEHAPAGGHYVRAASGRAGGVSRLCLGSGMLSSLSWRGRGGRLHQDYPFLLHGTAPVGFSDPAAVLPQTGGAVLGCPVASRCALVQHRERPQWEPWCAPASPAEHRCPSNGCRGVGDLLFPTSLPPQQKLC